MMGLEGTLRRVEFTLWVCLLIVLGLGPSRVEAVVIDRIIAVVNKDIVTLSEVQQAAKNDIAQLQSRFSGSRLKREIEKMERKFLDLLIRRRLQIQRANAMNLEVADNEIEEALEDVKTRNSLNDRDLEALLKREGLTMDEYRKRIREEILIRRVVNIEVRSRISVTPEEVRRYYDEHLTEFMPPERLRASHILFLTPVDADSDTERAKRAAANEVLEKIRRGADFAEMAKRYSQDPSASRGGDLGVIRRGEVLPNFERVLFAMKEGEVSDVARTRAGFHIIKLTSRLPRQPKPFKDVESEIRERIFQQKAEERFARWLDDLKKKAFIEVTM